MPVTTACAAGGLCEPSVMLFFILRLLCAQLMTTKQTSGNRRHLEGWPPCGRTVPSLPPDGLFPPSLPPDGLFPPSHRTDCSLPPTGRTVPSLPQDGLFPPLRLFTYCCLGAQWKRKAKEGREERGGVEEEEWRRRRRSGGGGGEEEEERFVAFG